jgi:hypothetical protein
MSLRSARTNERSNRGSDSWSEHHGAQLDIVMSASCLRNDYKNKLTLPALRHREACLQPPHALVSLPLKLLHTLLQSATALICCCCLLLVLLALPCRLRRLARGVVGLGGHVFQHTNLELRIVRR